MKKPGRLLSTAIHLLALTVLFWSTITPGSSRGQAAGFRLDPNQQAEVLLERMTPEERIGQLFLVTYQGQSVGPNTQIYDLIANHHIGGVVLLAKNDNITSPDSNPQFTIDSLVRMIASLQKNEWDASQESREDPRTGLEFTPTYAPLFIGVAQEGDGSPYDQILEGLTMLPNEMALGATWTPQMVEDAGKALGEQLSALGINLLLGPSLDVLDSPQLDSTSNLSTRTFGGDPYWVGQMGRAYIRGLHEGGAGSLAVVAKHFPGHGSSDRLPEEEVATVRKSLDELTSFDLAPFLDVTGRATSNDEITDALLTSHIRYQGLQGNIRATTRPVSFDPQALSLLFQLPELSAWRANGGLMVSDDLGNQAVRRFYDLTSQAFDARRVALNAFLAGNDLLYVADFSSTSEPDSYAQAVRTLEFFTQKYRDDSAFAARVNESALRILTLKMRLYPNFSLDEVEAKTGNLPNADQQNQLVFSIAQEAATLLSPTQAELDNTIPDPPNLNDRIVFITDTRSYQQCSTCLQEPEMQVDALQNAVIRLYGPQAGGQVVINNLTSFSLDDLEKLLNRHPERQTFEQNLERANWIVFSMLNERSETPSFDTLRRFLNERPDLFQSKRVLVFAFTAPYYLDATDISKISAYYALYSKSSPFVDVAAYLLFGELRPSGASPVSVPGINYDLNKALFPDPNQTIPLYFDLAPPQPDANPSGTPEPTPPPDFHLGDVIPLRTGVILDQNRHPVPDGTPVSFYFTIAGEGSSIRQTETTRDGIARTTFSVSLTGGLEIHAESEAARSEVLRVDIPSPGEELTTQTQAPTTPEPSLTPAPTLLQEVPPPTAAPTAAPTDEEPVMRLGYWFIAVSVAMAFGFLIYWLASVTGQVRWGIRAGMLALIGGLTTYSYLAWILANNSPDGPGAVEWSVFFSTMVGCVLGVLITLAWRYVSGLRHPLAVYGDATRSDSHRRLGSGPVSVNPPEEESAVAAESAHQGESQAGEK